MQPIMKLEGEKDTQRNPENVISTQAEHSSQQLVESNQSVACQFQKVDMVGLTCLPRARKTPPATADVASKTWNKATSGNMDATRDTTFGSSLNKYAQEERKTRYRELIKFNF